MESISVNRILGQQDADRIEGHRGDPFVSAFQ